MNKEKRCEFGRIIYGNSEISCRLISAREKVLYSILAFIKKICLECMKFKILSHIKCMRRSYKCNKMIRILAI